MTESVEVYTAIDSSVGSHFGFMETKGIDFKESIVPQTHLHHIRHKTWFEKRF